MGLVEPLTGAAGDARLGGSTAAAARAVSAAGVSVSVRPVAAAGVSVSPCRGLCLCLVRNHDVAERVFYCFLVLDPGERRRGLILIWILHVSPRFAAFGDETSSQPLGELCLELPAATRVGDAFSEPPALDDADRRQIRHLEPPRELGMPLDRDAYELERLVVASPLQDLREV